MNPDYTSDIRLVQRFIFESNLYLLTMFQKKINSFNSSLSWQNKDTRKQQKQSNLLSSTVIDCDNFLIDPLKNLAKDLTKPLWNCITKVDPKIIYRKQSAMEPIDLINTISQLFQSFFYRLKNQHKDQSNLKINICGFQFQKQVGNNSGQNTMKDQIEWNCVKSTNQLFEMLLAVVNKGLSELEQTMEDDGTQQNNISLRCMLLAAKEIFSLYLQQIGQNFNNQINIFNKIVVNSLSDLINYKIGPLVLCMQPKLMTLPLLMHPLFVSIHSLLKSQIYQITQKQQAKANKNANNLISSLNSLKITKSQKQIQSSPIIFNQLYKYQNLSKIVFINLDGYQSQFNIDIAKYLCKTLMYITFPKQSNFKYQNNNNENMGLYQDMMNMQDIKSQRLLHKYYHGGLTRQQKLRLLSHYKYNDKQLKKNLYVFPLHSRALSNRQKFINLHNYQSAFISFIMKQLMYSQILDFNPSIIIISYSQKIYVENQVFMQIIKQLTVIGNYKLVLYPNLSKSYLFQQYYEQQMKGIAYIQKQQNYFNKYQQNMKLIKQNNISISNNINCDLFQKLAIMIKISSGTYNLNRTLQADSFIEKYKNYKALAYVGPLIRKLAEQYPNLSKLKLRLADYTMTSKVLQNYFNNRSDTFDKLFFKVISKYHISLFKQLQSLLFNNINKIKKMDIQSNTITNTKNTNQQEIQNLINLTYKRYTLSQIKQNWISYKFQKLLQLSTQKVQSKYFVHLPRYKQYPSQNTYKKQVDNLICLQFFTIVDKQKTSVQLCPSASKVYYTPSRKYKNALIYITNHLIKNISSTYTHFCGLISQQFDYKVSPKVQLYPVIFKNGPTLNNYQTYTQFNYFQTKNYIFMFWPKLFDSRKQLLSGFCGVKYMAKSTSIFFCAHRKQPNIFRCIYDGSKTDYIIPRHGCSCYEIQGINTIYIFGGFYSNEKNYLFFQTDITKLQYKQQKQQNNNNIINILIKLQNIPKQFYFNYQQFQKNKQIKIINKLKNDMIRPKMLYQFLDMDKFVEKNGIIYKIVYIVGGIGEKFVRPYSMIGYMANKLMFNIQNGNLQQIQRINMQNIIPVNTYSAVKMRAPMEAKILSQAQNRSINFISGQSSPNSYTIYHNNITYNPQNQRFQYQKQYQFCDSQYKNYREQISLLKKTVAQSKTKLGICAKNVRGKDFNTNFITVSLQNDQKYLIQLQLIISLDVKNKNPQLPAYVRLTGQSIISIDVNSNVVYALIRHPKYTINQCILAYSDLNEISYKFRQNKPIQVPLKQIYKFDQNVSYNVLVAANINTIVLLHGLKFQKDAHVTQMIIRRNRKKHIKIDYIQSNTNYYNIQNSDITNKSCISNNPNNKLSFYDYPSVPTPGGLSCSIFLNQNNGNILCFSFKTIDRNPKSDSVFMIIQRLDLNNDKFIWQVILSKTYQFIIGQQKISHTQQPKRRRQKLKLVQIIQHKKQQQNINNSNNNYRYFYQFIGIYRDECHSAQYQIGFNNINNNINQKIVFIGNGKNQNQYYKELSKSSIKQNSVFLEKNIEDYNQLKDSLSKFRENTRREDNCMIEDQNIN